MADNSKLQIAMFPWLAFGHMIPWLELAKLIAQKGHKIFFISAPRNLDRLPKLPPNLASSIHFVKLPLPRVHNLPENAEATVDLSYDEVWYLKQASDCLQQPMKQLLLSLAPDWLLFDFTAHWLPSISRQLGIPNCFFSIFTAATLGYLGPSSVLINGSDDLKTPEGYARVPNWVPFRTTVAYRLFEAKKIFHLLTGDESNLSHVYRFGESLKGCDIIAVRSCMEFEPEWLKLVEQLHQKPVFPVGQLPTTDNDMEEETETWRWIKDWLDTQEKGSVVYVAFGSEAKPTQEELTEIALGLEQSKLPFFWVLKKGLGQADTELIDLPDGFEERTKGRGIVYTSWAPQLKILGHDSVGGFLTHSGWSSVVEGLQFGRALVLLTFYADQGLNAKLLQEKNIGYVIPREEEDGSFSSNSVAESLKLVFVEKDGEIYRNKAKEMKGLFGERERPNLYVDNFLSYLETHRFLHKSEEMKSN
ncbi:UDP-glycosyltransferase [Melia azedarach]|uniref:UDP-glycosyltransferase n=1 Tax=Melia azedarach TaxID=155640 RepID=A0ACC1XTX8_MELAZ|nr:UDP-glycosyltransferase [Melia azedarach]